MYTQVMLSWIRERYPALPAALHALLDRRGLLEMSPAELLKALEPYRQPPWPANPVALSLWLKRRAGWYGLEVGFHHDGLQRWVILQRNLKNPYRLECFLPLVEQEVRKWGRAVVNNIEFTQLEGRILSEPVNTEKLREFAGVEEYRVCTAAPPYLPLKAGEAQGGY